MMTMIVIMMVTLMMFMIITVMVMMVMTRSILCLNWITSSPALANTPFTHYS